MTLLRGRVFCGRGIPATAGGISATAGVIPVKTGIHLLIKMDPADKPRDDE